MVRGSLNGGALHVVQDAAHTTQFFAAAGATRATVDEVREGRAVAGRRLRIIAVEEVQAAVMGGDAECILACQLRVMRNNGGNQRARAQGGELDGLGGGVVTQEGDDGAEGLGVVDSWGAVIGKAQDSGVEERALGLLAAVDYLAAAGLELLDGLRDVLLLICGDQRTHGGGGIARIAHDHLVAQACAEGFNGGVDKRMRDDGAADGGTFLARL